LQRAVTPRNRVCAAVSDPNVESDVVHCNSAHCDIAVVAEAGSVDTYYIHFRTHFRSDIDVFVEAESVDTHYIHFRIDIGSVVAVVVAVDTAVEAFDTHTDRYRIHLQSLQIVDHDWQHTDDLGIAAHDDIAVVVRNYRVVQCTLEVEVVVVVDIVAVLVVSHRDYWIACSHRHSVYCIGRIDCHIDSCFLLRT